MELFVPSLLRPENQMLRQVQMFLAGCRPSDDVMEEELLTQQNVSLNVTQQKFGESRCFLPHKPSENKPSASPRLLLTPHPSINHPLCSDAPALLSHNAAVLSDARRSLSSSSPLSSACHPSLVISGCVHAARLPRGLFSAWKRDT